MPFKRESASFLGGETFLANETVRQAISQCEASFPDPEPCRAIIRDKVINVTERIYKPKQGRIIACDGSRYEASARDDFPSIRCGFLKFSQVMIEIQAFHKLRKSDGFVSQIGAARVTRDSNAYGIALTGAGMSLSGLSPLSTFRQFLFDAFHNEIFEGWGSRLIDTFVELIRRLGRVSRKGGKEYVLVQELNNPLTGEKFKEEILIPVDPGYVEIPGSDGERLFITDVLRLHDVFVDEGDNTGCYQRAMNAIEHILLAHVLRALDSDSQYRSALSDLVVMMDGPLSINGEPAVFHRPIMELVHSVGERFGDPWKRPLVIGVAKSGPVVEHGEAIKSIIRSGPDDQRALLVPLDDIYRYTHIDKGPKNLSRNFGERTHYGQDFLYSSPAGRMFHLCIAYPFSSKRIANFQTLKSDINSYGPLVDRAISVLNMLETPLYENANIAQHLANSYASIAHRPTGKNLDDFLRSIVAASGARV